MSSVSFCVRRWQPAYNWTQKKTASCYSIGTCLEKRFMSQDFARPDMKLHGRFKTHFVGKEGKMTMDERSFQTHTAYQQENKGKLSLKKTKQLKSASGFLRLGFKEKGRPKMAWKKTNPVCFIKSSQCCKGEKPSANRHGLKWITRQPKWTVNRISDSSLQTAAKRFTFHLRCNKTWLDCKACKL